jgi:hypothetical protein
VSLRLYKFERISKTSSNCSIDDWERAACASGSLNNPVDKSVHDIEGHIAMDFRRVITDPTF